MRIARNLITIALALGLAALGGCSDEPATGTMTIWLTDAPFPFEMIAAAELGVDGAEVHLSGVDGNDSGFHVVSDSASVLNLLELSNGVSALVGHTTLPAGTVNQMRLLVSSASIRLADDRTFELNVPSGESSGLKVFFEPPIEIAADTETNVLVDVDVSRSFSSIPASPQQMTDITGFRFHPVLRVAVSEEAGRLAGRVTASADGSPIPSATVSLWEEGAAVTSTVTGANGEWMILGVSPGVKTVQAEATGYITAQTTATVIAQETTSGVDLALDPMP